MEMTVIVAEFGLFVAILSVISWQFYRSNKRLGKIIMDQATFVDKLNALSTSIDAAVAKIGSAPQAVDFQPLGDAVDAMKAKLDSANPPA